MEGVENRAYMLGCISSVFAALQATIEWSSRWAPTQPLLMRLLVCLPLATPLVVAMWIAVFTSNVIVRAATKGRVTVVVSTLAALVPWLVGVLTCYSHASDFPSHYCVALLLTGVVYGIDSRYTLPA
jgi:hypothetical protein